ncbi:hypothetical protein FB561_3822 [Kribbella amoyensis]|uniref:Uncharacterized protein n=1 Tax=Kribbella amoyensis TaxID=996641 RepID=A0A561BV73_9ACTN|nr:hypothetical protein FB561_3822 [Kribbella amoyensis]
MGAAVGAPGCGRAPAVRRPEGANKLRISTALSFHPGNAEWAVLPWLGLGN